jgi:3-phosphoshikimate 1-carboxyvinyltransferase
MIKTSIPSTISGTIQAPASKSSMQRACAAALLQNGTTIIQNPGHSNDDKSALDTIQKMGAAVTVNADKSLTISSTGINPKTDVVNCGESGLGIRMFTPLVALSERQLTVTGTGSLTVRPMDFFDEIFPQIGIQIKSNGGKLPLEIKGPLQPKNIEIDGSLSSQFLTGLLMAYSASNATDVSIKVKDLKSKPYIDLTFDVMKAFGMKLPENNNYETFYFNTTTHHSAHTTHYYSVEGDWSGGAFLLVAGAIAGKIEVKGLQETSSQADKKIMEALKASGAVVRTSGANIVIEKPETALNPFEFDATDCPDLFPPLVALAANCVGITKIKGLKRLKHKEGDRGITLQKEFAKLDTKIEFDDDIMLVHGKGKITVLNDQLSSHHDHRIAMACAVAGLCADKPVHIHDAEAVNKSYADFWDDLKMVTS